ncbi:MAG: NADH:flavin oxidoreductase/NADH oxidase [Bradyrhizobium sp.]|nr:NADH:flavin oxidoreductase/NADH oxidase [Bradyrhizobium sp.]
MTQVMDGAFLHEDNAAFIFSPLKFRRLEIKNRLFRSNLSGMFDEYNGYGGHTRINWEEKFAKGGVGCIISSYTPRSGNARSRACVSDWRRLSGCGCGFPRCAPPGCGGAPPRPLLGARRTLAKVAMSEKCAKRKWSDARSAILRYAAPIRPTAFFDGNCKDIANAAFGPDDTWRLRVYLQLAPQPQHLNIDAAIEDVFAEPGRLQQILAATAAAPAHRGRPAAGRTRLCSGQSVVPADR